MVIRKEEINKWWYSQHKCKYWWDLIALAFKKDGSWQTLTCKQCKEQVEIFIPNPWNIFISLNKKTWKIEKS